VQYRLNKTLGHPVPGRLFIPGKKCHTPNHGFAVFFEGRFNPHPLILLEYKTFQDPQVFAVKRYFFVLTGKGLNR
jgi:hypothetical protein